MLGHLLSHSNSAGSPGPTAFCSKPDLFQDQATSISSLLSPGFLIETDLAFSSLLTLFHYLQALSIRQMAYTLPKTYPHIKNCFLIKLLYEIKIALNFIAESFFLFLAF